jgi:hypothetical protein
MGTLSAQVNMFENLNRGGHRRQGLGAPAASGAGRQQGEKVLPGLLVAALDPLPRDATVAEKLKRLERLGALP